MRRTDYQVEVARAGYIAGGVDTALGIVGSVLQTWQMSQFIANMSRDPKELKEGDTWIDPGRYHPDREHEDGAKRVVSKGQGARVHHREDGHTELLWPDGRRTTVVDPKLPAPNLPPPKWDPKGPLSG